MRLNDELACIGVRGLLQARVGGRHNVDVKPVGNILSRGDELAGWDAAKAILSLCAPIGGAIAQRNELLAAHPDLGCIDSYGRGWIVTVKPTHWDDDRIYLLTARAYLEFAKYGEHISLSSPH